MKRMLLPVPHSRAFWLQTLGFPMPVRLCYILLSPSLSLGAGGTQEFLMLIISPVFRIKKLRSKKGEMGGRMV